MNKKILAAIGLIIFISVIAAMPSLYSTSHDDEREPWIFNSFVYAEVTRNIVMSDKGYCYLSDNVMLYNTGGEEVRSFLLGIPDESNLTSFTIMIENKKADISEWGRWNNVSYYEILLPKPLLPSREVSISVSNNYQNEISYNSSSMNLNVSIVSHMYNFRIKSMSGSVQFPSGCSISAKEESNFISMSGATGSFFLRDLPPLTPLPIKLEGYYASSAAILKCHYLEKTIKIDVWSGVHIRDKFYLENLGPKTIDEFEIYLPNALNIEVRDYLGRMSFEMDNITQLLTVHPRYKMDTNSTYEFVIEYDIPVNDSTANIYLTTIMPWECGNISINFIKIGAEISRMEYTSASFRKISPSADGFFIVDAAPAENITIILKYDVSPRFFVRPLIFTLLPIIAIGLLALYRKFVPAELEEELEEYEVDVKELYELCSERFNKRSDLMDLEEKARDKKVNKEIYRKRKATLEKQLSMIDSKIHALETRIPSGTQLKLLLEKIDAAEARRTAAMAALSRLYQAYKSKKITYKAYLGAKEEHENALKKAIETITSALVELKTLITS